MIYKFKIPGKRGPEAKAVISFLTGKTKLFINGKEIEKQEKNVYQIPITKTRKERLRLSPNVFELGLDIIYKDERKKVSKDVTKLEYVTSYFPFILGLISTSYYNANIYASVIIGVLSIFFSLYNMKILQSDKNGLAKLIYNAAIVGVSWLVFMLIAKI
ncbi:MAG: hypothetical protein ACLFPS_08625 [Clostridia bacterium]